ncbi:MAG: SDR family oxidoreductase [Anaerolineaceae bacterium]|nr:SDR family oxidoreductase [Anaerolineaceae bacterium]
MNEKVLANKTALVTGASSGLGVDFARQLAARGANLVLVARRPDQLCSVAAEIEKEYAVSALPITMDLAEPAAPQALYDQLEQQGVQIDILVNNAGFGVFGKFVEIPWERHQAMLDIDIVALTHLTRLFLPDMLSRSFGYVLQVASNGAYQPTPTYAAYSAAKSYVLSKGEAINYELRGSGVSVTVISPGVTATEFLMVSGQPPSFYQRPVHMDSETVARIGIASMLRRRPSVVPGFINSLVAFSTRLVPRRTLAPLAYYSMTK